MINTNTIFSLEIGIQHPPGRPKLYPGTICLYSCLIVNLLKRSPSREQDTRRDNEEENLESGKSKIIHGISGYERFFHGKSEFHTPPGGPLLQSESSFEYNGGTTKGLPFDFQSTANFLQRNCISTSQFLWAGSKIRFPLFFDSQIFHLCRNHYFLQNEDIF